MSFLPETDSEDELPPGWEEKITDDGLVCYTNNHIKVTQWLHPRTGRFKRIPFDLPIGWEKYFDKGANCVAFRNKETNQTTYVDPRMAFATEEPPMNVTHIRQRFDACSTALQVLHGKDLTGRVALITGANAGIGYETARTLVLHGCTVIFACRNASATEEAIDNIVKEQPSLRELCSFVMLDLASFKSVDNFVHEVKRTVSHIDYLILNAGVFGLPYTKTEDDIETTFQVSHLAQFHLTLQLKPLLDEKSRVVVVSSESHRYANLSVDNLTEQHLSPPREKYWSMMAYNNVKLCNILFTKELAERWKQDNITVFALHPGNMVSTHLQRNWWLYRLLFAIVRPFTKSLQQAAATSIFAATSSDLNGLTSIYLNNCFFCESSKLSNNEEIRRRVWELSEKMVQTAYEGIKNQNIN